MRRPSSSGLTRVEASAQARRRRAMAHLEKVQNRQQHESLPVRRALALVALASIGTGLLVGASGSLAEPVNRVWVAGARWVPAAEIAATTQARTDDRAAELDADALAEELATHAWITSARVLLLPGGDLLVGVTEREPAALLAGEPRWAVDADGVAFAPAPAEGLEDLVVVTAVKRPELGEPDPDLARAVSLARRLPELGLPAAASLAIAAPDDPKGLSLMLPGSRTEVVLGRDDLDARLADLARLLEAGLPELEGAARIDLRFEDQAVLDVDPSLEGAEQAAAQRGGAAPSEPRRAG